jgi:DNA-directed RNA polymerase subunit L
METVTTSLNGYRMDAELKNVPVAFVNSLRRILLAEIPTVIVSNVEILENSSSMTHEMLRHRTQMLPVNVRANEAAVIRDTKLEVRVTADKEPREVTTADFVATGPRSDILLPDRDLGTPLLFVVLKPGETIHIKMTLSIATTGSSQVCVSTFKNHIDPDIAKADRDTFIAQAGDDETAQREAARMFDTFHIQRSFHRNEAGRPDWFDFTVESIGVTPAKDLMRTAITVLQSKIADFGKAPVLREKEGDYRMEMPGETFTIGYLVQEMIYIAGTTEMIFVEAGHPLIPKLAIRFHTKTMSGEEVIAAFVKEASALCENVLGSV